MGRYRKKILICVLIGFGLLLYAGRTFAASESNSQISPKKSSNISGTLIDTQQNPTLELIKKPVLDELLIVSTSSEDIPDNSSKLVGYKDNVDLFAVAKDNQGNYYLGWDNSLPDRIKVDNIIYSTESETLKRWNEELWGKPVIKWYKIMPKMQPSQPDSNYKWYSNVFTTKGPDEGKFSWWQVIEYTQSPLGKEGWTIRLEKKVGTARFRAETIYNGQFLSSPGKEDLSEPSNIAAEDYDRGIKPSVHCISRLSNHENKLIRYMEALKGVPWLWGADYRGERDDPTNHQTELPNPIGIECADLIISALRAMGNKDLQYTAAKDLGEGIYNLPIDERVFKFATNEIFKNWTPQGLAYQNGYYICGKGKIKIFDPYFRLKRIIKKPSSHYLDIAISPDNQIYVINNSKDRQIEIFDEEGNLKNHFRPKIECISEIEDQFYIWEKKIRPRGIDLDKETGDIYLLASDSLYIFDEEENLKKGVKLEGLYEDFVPLGPLTLEDGQVYIPVHGNQILIYSLSGKIINKMSLGYTVLAMDKENEKYYLIPYYLRATLPLCIEIRDIEGALLANSYERFVDEKGKNAVIRIGTSEGEIRIAGLILSKEEKEENFSHTLILYEDSNKNGLLDYNDKLIYAGHEGVMIDSVEEKLEKRSFILRRLDESIIKID